MKITRYRNIFTSWLIRLNGGVVVSFKYVGEKGKYQIHSQSYLHYNPLKDEFLIDWTNGTNELITRKK